MKKFYFKNEIDFLMNHEATKEILTSAINERYLFLKSINQRFTKKDIVDSIFNINMVVEQFNLFDRLNEALKDFNDWL